MTLPSPTHPWDYYGFSEGGGGGCTACSVWFQECVLHLKKFLGHQVSESFKSERNTKDGGNRGTLWCRRARDSSPLTESTLLSQPLHVYGLSASCLWCGCVEADDKYGRSLLASNMYVLTPSRKGVFARLPAYLEASRAPAVYDRRIDSPQTAVMQTRNASDMDAVRKLGAASATSVRRKTLCDITNLRRPLVAAGRVEVRGRRGWDRVVGQGKIC
ncbi:uncharacterized protein [Aegilops tauschii subsp. strangulata]|uniref:uncharacterized protein isoform X1 n=1 Tax=Aegilops tauschii subsp. strangulata TaxID=200361 RepID=UPI001E1CAFAA|nr:uncharacterized protein LOC109746965 isoform X2 [Aegilops tauschii subsp. strangulata]XP_045087848.1 uncharacterized protein LOC109746965 isoform X2 [Aegilops tauschii subsp. strangulata]XP_045087849.1 uncharacterized protein LOC109746965 isoform X2 [Aegilops tauschii subsp. strangulata]XP_045087850.1 uncharacterized protein LOC109746965 isoform X2 [Aegilops tauschii subsp. strangulata]